MSLDLHDLILHALPSEHFLAQPRPDAALGPPVGTVDTTTLAAHDFDVDTRTGFMPPQPPITRLPPAWESWEELLDDARDGKLKLGERPDLSEDDKALSDRWRARVREMPVLPTDDLKLSELLLRRAHLVLAWIMHFYIRTLPPSTADVRVPAPLTLPLLQVSQHLQLPPVLTYSDDVLYNWALKHAEPLAPAPSLDNLRCVTLFTGTQDEEEFYLASARIELRGVEALGLMRATMDEAFVGDEIAIRRISAYLHSLSVVIADLTKLLLAVREGCDPDVFYHQIRPWFRGADSDANAPQWIFEGIERDPTLHAPVELSGPSAGQSALVHALDIFLGVDKYSHAAHMTGKAGQPAPAPAHEKAQASFLERMKLYMPRHHRAFLGHLQANPRPLRALVEGASDAKLTEAYNAAVGALKVFRDAHVRIVALYIVGPSRRAGQSGDAARGTGGTSAIRFVKSVRDQTASAVIPQPEA
ncbi:indoleamine 2,3-dioxygenase [Phanerochaete sordida]|uniref:Indoleamine 2,3-dioxygenase n=1 Tax=Phanerochaete sordida TaxID=48140 RepID=A0A9P3G8L5_9APHY|nr:indoleamine 2,3-dioxygenase [Phanerochaete sordida]